MAGSVSIQNDIVTYIQFEIISETEGSKIREIPDHATFRGKDVNTGLVSQAWGFPLFDPM